MLRRLVTTDDADMSLTPVSDMIHHPQAVTALPEESVLEVPTAGVLNRRRPREEEDDDDDESDSSTPHLRAAPTLYDTLHFVVWNGYGREVGKAIGAAKVLDTAEMYQSKDGLAQIVYRIPVANDQIDLRTRLMFVAMKGDIARTRLLLENRADVHVDDDMALQLAISHAHADVARLLIEHGADVRLAFSKQPLCENVDDRAAYRALIRELMNAHPTVCAGDVLIIAIANSDAALVSQTVDSGFVELGDWARGVLVDDGLLSECIERETGPEIAATARALFAHPFFSYREKIVMAGHVASNNKEGIAWVRELSVLPEAATNVDELLWAASCAGLVDIVNSCLNRDGDPNIDPMDWDPSDCAIMKAACTGRREVVVVLAQRDDIDLDWALVAAACIGSLALCTYLLNKNADAGWVSDDSEESAVQYSIEKGYVEILRLLLKHKSARRSARRNHYLWRSAMEADKNVNDIVRILLKKKILPKVGDLCYAAESGKRHVVQNILAAEVEGVNEHSSVTLEDANAHWQTAGELYELVSFTPLLSACYGLQKKRRDENPANESDYVSIVRLLCEAGANLEARIDVTSHRVVQEGYGGGFTPLLLASRVGSAAVVDELLAHGTDINGRCANGQTALFYAREQGHDIIAQTLVARGATL